MGACTPARASFPTVFTDSVSLLVCFLYTEASEMDVAEVDEQGNAVKKERVALQICSKSRKYVVHCAAWMMPCGGVGTSARARARYQESFYCQQYRRGAARAWSRLFAHAHAPLLLCTAPVRACVGACVGARACTPRATFV